MKVWKVTPIGAYINEYGHTNWLIISNSHSIAISTDYRILLDSAEFHMGIKMTWTVRPIGECVMDPDWGGTVWLIMSASYSIGLCEVSGLYMAKAGFPSSYIKNPPIGE